MTSHTKVAFTQTPSGSGCRCKIVFSTSWVFTLHFLISVPWRLLIFDILVRGYAAYSGGYGNFILGIGHPATLASTAWLRTGRLTPGWQPTWRAVILSQFRVSRAIIISHSQEIMFWLISKQYPCNLQMTFVNKNPLISINQLQNLRWFGPMSDNGAAIWHLNLGSDWAFLDQFESQICDNYIVLCLIQRK